MVGGIAVAIAAIGFMAAVAHPIAWIAARFVIGAGLALPWLISDVWINTIAPEQSRGKIVLGYVISLFAGFAVGPLILQATGIVGVLPLGLAVLAMVFAVMPLIFTRKFAPVMSDEEDASILTPLRTVPVMAVGGIVLQVTSALIADRVSREALPGSAGLALIGAAYVLHVTAPAALIYASLMAGGISLAIYAFAMAYLGPRLQPSALAAATASFLVMY